MTDIDEALSLNETINTTAYLRPYGARWHLSLSLLCAEFRVYILQLNAKMCDFEFTTHHKHPGCTQCFDLRVFLFLFPRTEMHAG